MRPIRVLIADDHPDVLSALVSLVESDSRFVVVGTAANGADAHRLAGENRVDLVLLDVNMPGGGAPAAQAILALEEPPILVAISAESGSTVIEEMMRAGAAGYLTKGRIGDRLTDLLARYAGGEAVDDTSVAGGP